MTRRIFAGWVFAVTLLAIDSAGAQKESRLNATFQLDERAVIRHFSMATGSTCDLKPADQRSHVRKIQSQVEATRRSLECHAGNIGWIDGNHDESHAPKIAR